MKSIENILSLSDDENKLVNEAKNTYPKIFPVTLEFLDLIGERFSLDKSNKVSPLFFCQVSNNFTLSVFSALRRHSTQFHVMLRQAIESVILLHYSFYNTDPNIYGEYDAFGYYKFDGQKIFKKAVKLLSINYPYYSDLYKEYKDAINDTFSHVNIFSAELISTKFNDDMKYSYFDTYVPEYVEEALLLINEIMRFTVEFLMLFCKQCRFFDFEDNITKKFIDTESNHNKILTNYFNSERAKEFIDDNRFEWMNKKVKKKTNLSFQQIAIPKEFLFDELFIYNNLYSEIEKRNAIDRKTISNLNKNYKLRYSELVMLIKRIRTLYNNKKNQKKNKEFIFPDLYNFFKWYINQYNEQKGCCYYCGISEEILVNLYDKNILSSKRSKNRGRHLEIDRKDSNGKYREDNCVLSCYFCNNDKSDIFTENDYLEYLEDRKLFFENKYRNINSN